MKLLHFCTILCLASFFCLPVAGQKLSTKSSNDEAASSNVRINECVSEIYIDSTLITSEALSEVTKIRVFKKFDVKGNYRVGISLRKKDGLIALYAPLYTSDEADRIVSDSLFEMVGVNPHCS